MLKHCHRFVLVLAFLTLVLLAAAPRALASGGGATDEQWNASLLIQLPGVGDFDVYSRGIGVEAQYRRWYGFGGIAFSLGAEQWSTESESSNWGAQSPSRVSGDLTLVPIGVSAIGRWPIREGLLLRGEAGVRYVWTDSGIRVRMPDWEASESVDIKDGWISLAGIGVEQLLTETLMLFGGIRYQHDIVRADARTPRGPLMNNHLRSFTFQVGIQFWY